MDFESKSGKEKKKIRKDGAITTEKLRRRMNVILGVEFRVRPFNGPVNNSHY